MVEPAARPWSVEQFFAWQARQPDRHELVGGWPLKMMTSARNVHGRISASTAVRATRTASRPPNTVS